MRVSVVQPPGFKYLLFLYPRDTFRVVAAYWATMDCEITSEIFASHYKGWTIAEQVF